MRHMALLDWEIVEVEEEEWQELIAESPPEPSTPKPGRRMRTILSMVFLSVGLVAALGYRVWLEAERGLAQIERHLGALVQTETLRVREDYPGGEFASDVKSIEINGSGALVRVVVTDTTPLGKIVTHEETRFYKPGRNGWAPTGPLVSFWGRPAELETTSIHFAFYERDRPFVEQFAAPADTFHRALRAFLGVPALSATTQLSVTIAARNVALGTLTPQGELTLRSPQLIYSHPDQPADAILYTRLQDLLVARTL